MNEPKFQVGDKIRIRKESEIPDERKQDYQQYQVLRQKNFQNRSGVITHVSRSADDDVVYTIKTSIVHTSTKSRFEEPFIIHIVPEYALDHEFVLTPDTDAVFRDILRGI